MFLSESLKAQRTQRTLKEEGNVRITEGTEDAEDTEGRGNCLNQDFQDYRIFRIRDKRRGFLVG